MGKKYIECNIQNFKNYITSATLSNSIDFVQMNISKDRVHSKLTSSDREVMSFFDKDNNILEGLEDDETVVWNFKDPYNYVIPFLRTLDSDIVQVSYDAQKIVFKNGKSKLKLSLSMPDQKNIIPKNLKEDRLKSFTEVKIGEDFFDSFEKIKKIAGRFGKVYLTIEDNTVYLETTDKTNMFSNELKIQIGELEYDDMNLNFDFKYMVALINSVNSEYTMKFDYMKTQKCGFIYFASPEQDEMYILSSRQES